MRRPVTLVFRFLLLAAVAGVSAAAYENRDALAGDTVAHFNTGGLELTIDSKGFYNGAPYATGTWALKDLIPTCDHFFKFFDIKPGDWGKDRISIHVKKNPAYACLDFKNLKNKENGKTEPEAQADHTSAGELAKETEFFAWFDQNGDGTFQPSEKPIFGTGDQSAVKVLNDTTYPLADAKHGTAFADGSTHYIGIEWCAGNLTVNLANGKIACDGSAMGNEAQTDSFTVDVSVRAVSSKDEPKFLCASSGGDDSHGDDHGGKGPDKYDDRNHYVSHGYFDYGHGVCSPSGRK